MRQLRIGLDVEGIIDAVMASIMAEGRSEERQSLQGRSALLHELTRLECPANHPQFREHA